MIPGHWVIKSNLHHMQNNAPWSLSHTTHKTYSRWIEDQIGKVKQQSFKR